MRSKNFFSCLFLVTLLAVAGCAVNEAVDVSSPVAMVAVAERAPGSLEFDVMDYHWTYLNRGAHIRVKGKIRNNSGTPFQSVTLHAIVYDEGGRVFARGSSYLAPTYLKPGAVADFEFVAAAARDSGVTNTRLASNCQTTGI